MRIAFAIKSLNVHGGGAERVLVQVANGLARRGHALVVMDFDSPGTSFYPLDAAVERIDLAVGPPGQPTPRGRLLAALPRMRAAMRGWRPDVVVGFMHSMYVPLGIALMGAGWPVVASEHAVFQHFRGRFVQRVLVALGRRLFVAKTVPSASLRSAHPHAQRPGIAVLPNPVDLDAFAGIAASAPAVPPTVLAVGRFMEEKNHVELIAAYAQVAAQFPEWRLRIVGDGELRPQVEAAVAAHGMTEFIELPGATTQIAGEYARAAFVVVPSRYESFGMVTAEALACGRPVVGFADSPGTNELVNHEVNGLLVEGGAARVANLAAGLRRLMQDAPLRARLGAGGPAAVTGFSNDAVIDAWEQFLLDGAARQWRTPAKSPAVATGADGAP